MRAQPRYVCGCEPSCSYLSCGRRGHGGARGQGLVCWGWSGQRWGRRRSLAAAAAAASCTQAGHSSQPSHAVCRPRNQTHLHVQALAHSRRAPRQQEGVALHRLACLGHLLLLKPVQHPWRQRPAGARVLHGVRRLVVGGGSGGGAVGVRNLLQHTGRRRSLAEHQHGHQPSKEQAATLPAALGRCRACRALSSPRQRHGSMPAAPRGLQPPPQRRLTFCPSSHLMLEGLLNTAHSPACSMRKEVVGDDLGTHQRPPALTARPA